MPHLTIEYSANLRDSGRFAQLCEALGKTLAAQTADGKAVYPLGGIRVRAYAADTWYIANGAADNAFVHLSLKVATGRSEATRKATGDALFDVLKAHFEEQFEQQGLALSLDITEFGEGGTWKHNNLHARLKP
jgi:5-carboxymethyl-2-hydroxymuconate isomerase